MRRPRRAISRDRHGQAGRRAGGPGRPPEGRRRRRSPRRRPRGRRRGAAPCPLRIRRRAGAFPTRPRPCRTPHGRPGRIAAPGSSTSWRHAGPRSVHWLRRSACARLRVLSRSRSWLAPSGFASASGHGSPVGSKHRPAKIAVRRERLSGLCRSRGAAIGCAARWASSGWNKAILQSLAGSSPFAMSVSIGLDGMIHAMLASVQRNVFRPA